MKKVLSYNDFWLATLAFSIVRIVFYCVGIRMDFHYLYHSIQFAELSLLKENLGETLFYMHGQPPLFNLYIGSVLKVFPHHFELFFQANFIFMGWLQVILLVSILHQLDIRRTIIGIILGFYILLPAAILFENWFFYTYPIVTLFLLSLYSLICFIEKETLLRGGFFFSTLAIIALTRSMFHLVWLIMLFSIFIFYRKKLAIPLPKLALSFVLPFCFVFAWYLKNMLLFGTFTASSWGGYNLSRMTIQREDTTSFNNIKQQAIAESDTTLYPNIALLHRLTKDGNQNNWFHIQYIFIFKKMSKESIILIKANPMDYLKKVTIAHTISLKPSNKYLKLFSPNNYNRMKPYLNVFNIGVTANQIEAFPSTHPMRLIQCVPVALLYLLVLYSLWHYRLDFKFLSLKMQSVLLFILFNTLYIAVIGNFLESGENMRFRFQATPIGLILIAIIINHFFVKKTTSTHH